MSISFVAEAHGTANYQTSINVSKPTGTANGDVMIAICGGTPSTPSGWTLLGSADSGTNSLRTVRVFRKVASGEDSSYTFNISSSIACASIVTYRGVDNISPVDTTDFDISSVTTSSNFNTTSVTATATQWGLTFAMGYEYGSSSTRIFSEGSGTERSDFSVSNSGSPDNTNCSVTDSSGNLTAGSFTRVQTRSVACDGGVKAVVLLNQAGGGITNAAAVVADGTSVTAYNAVAAIGIGATAGKAAATVSALNPQVLSGQVVHTGSASAVASCPDIGRRVSAGVATASATVQVAHVYYGAPAYRTFRIPPDEPLNPQPL